MKKKIIAFLLAAAMTLSACPVNVRASVSNNSTIANTKVDIDDDVVLAASAKNADMDYSFLADFAYGQTNRELVSITFNSTGLMAESTLKNLSIGTYVRTLGYYRAGDGGAATYYISKEATTGSIALNNGLYANYVPDIYTDPSGTNWYVGNVRQFGAVADSVTPDERAINNAFSCMDTCTNENADILRGIMYIPAGEYKTTNQINVNAKNLNIVGAGSETVLFTDNDYRKSIGYSEFYYSVWGANNCYIADFVLEAREVDLYHYMRQFVCVYSTDVYVKNVDMLIPQECYNCYYYQDKQYSNFCAYSGNTRITVDGCKMVQMTGTYRGANVGVLDIWAAGEQDITVMNCELYGNARDEQIGFFSRDSQSAFVHNVEFINNTIHAYQPKYVSTVGNATMRFTVAYDDSNDVDNIHIAGNHFIVECDSKFMTFGKVTNCVIEDNIIEVYCTYSTWSMVFDSCNSDPDNILVQNNEFFLTTNERTGKGNFIGGNLTFNNNRVVCDTALPFGMMGSVVNDNELIFLKNVGRVCDSPREFNKNTVVFYGGTNTYGMYDRQLAAFGTNTHSMEFNDNIIYNYVRDNTTRSVHQSLFILTGDIDKLTIKNNQYYAPNKYYEHSNFSADTKYTDENGKSYYLDHLFKPRYGTYNSILVENNVFQTAEDEDRIQQEAMAATKENGTEYTSPYLYKNNTYPMLSGELSEPLCNRVEITHSGKAKTEMSTTAKTVTLAANCYIPDTYDENGNLLTDKLVSDKNLHWISSVESIATVDNNGVVTRKGYGDVVIYAVCPDGNSAFGKMKLHFEKAKSTEVVLNKDSVDLQVGLRYYVDYTVMPNPSASQAVKFTSANPSIATIDCNGRVEAVSLGSTYVTVKTLDGTNAYKKLKVNVVPNTVRRIDLSTYDKFFDCSMIGSTYQLTPTFYPGDAVNAGVSRYVSSDENVATVDKNGLITIVGGGTCRVYVYGMDESIYTACYLYVTPAPVKNLRCKNTNTSITLNWDASPGATGYYIYELASDNNTWNRTSNGSVNGTSFTYNNLTPGSSHTLKVEPFLACRPKGNYTEFVNTALKDSQITTETLDFAPVTSITTTYNWNVFCIKNSGVQLGTTFYANPNTADNRKLNFQFADNDFVSIDHVTVNPDNPGQHDVYVKTTGTGKTTLTATAADGSNVSRTIEFFVLPNEKMDSSKITWTASHESAVINFTGFANESGMDGYKVGIRTGYHTEKDTFVPAKGNNSQYTVSFDGLEDGKTYEFLFYPCSLDSKGNMVISNFYGYSASVYVTLPEFNPASRLTFPESVVKLTRGQSQSVYCAVSATDKTRPVSTTLLDWYSYDTNVVTVTPYKQTQKRDYADIYAIQCGVANIGVLTTDGTNLKSEFTVVSVPDKKPGNVRASVSSTVVKLKWDAIDDVDGYVVLRYNIETGKWVEIGDTTDLYFKISNCMSNTTYKFRVAGYVKYNGQKYRGALSTTYSATTNPATIVTKGDITKQDLALSGTSFEWNGNKQVPTVQSDYLVPNVDYTVTYENSHSSDIGTYQVTIHGVGNYTGTLTLTYKIRYIVGNTYTIDGYRYTVTGYTAATMAGTTTKTRTTIKIPSTIGFGAKEFKVTAIAEDAFANMSTVAKVVIGENIRTIGNGAFTGINENAKIYVPADAIDSIKALLTSKTGYVKTMTIVGR